MKYIPFEGYNFLNDVVGEPQNFNGILFYPLRINQKETWDKLSILYIKNKILEEPILRTMSLLKYLLFVNRTEQGIQQDLNLDKIIKRILETVTKQEVEFYWAYSFKDWIECKEKDNLKYRKYDEYFFTDYIIEDEKMAKSLKFFIHFKESNIFLADSNFNIVKKILIYQNKKPIERLKITSKEMYDDLNTMKKDRLKSSNYCTFEEEVALHKIFSHDTYEDIFNYTFRQFYVFLDKCINLKMYEIEMTGQISYKDESNYSPHFLTHIPEKGIYDGLLIAGKPVMDKYNRMFK